MTALFFLFVGMGALMIALAIPLIQRRVPPNWVYWFRIRRTIENPDIWYPANVYAGKWLVGLGLVIIGTSVVAYLIPGISEGAFSVIVSTVLLIVMIVMLIDLFRYLKHFPD